ncbi:MAG: Fpg/Nei family DNA glycosylase [Candidatus Hydrogenedentota bacterium]
MPELPDVAVFQHYIEQHALNRTIARVTVNDDRLLRKGTTPQSLGQHLTGNRLTKTHRHGKYLLVKLSNDHWLVLHFGMTGEPQCYPHGGEPPDYTRVAIFFEKGDHLAIISRRMLGQVGVTESPEHLVEQEELGPDALSKTLSGDALHELFGGRTAMIKSLLMNQNLIAGIGNVYADEILFQAIIHPETPANELDPATYDALFAVMRRVLLTAARRKVTPTDLPKRYLLRARETDERCPRCRAELAHIRVSGRGTWICPRCQKR